VAQTWGFVLMEGPQASKTYWEFSVPLSRWQAYSLCYFLTMNVIHVCLYIKYERLCSPVNSTIGLSEFRFLFS
jgi:hypothetical protein